MCTVLPSPGSRLTLRVSFVEVHAGMLLVRLWGLPGERREEYLRLAEEIQAKVGPRLGGAPGGGGDGGGSASVALGDLCLVELGGRWHRCRVVSHLPGPGQGYRVFLLDEGRTVSAGPYYLARGCDELFYLPSEVLGCILADLVPAGRTEAALAATSNWEPKGWASQTCSLLRFGWTASAVEFLGYLHGKEVSGLVREVLIAQRLVVLELPWLLAQMHHLGLARQVCPNAFRTLLNNSLGTPSVTSSLPEQFSSSAPTLGAPAQTQPGTGALDYFYPRLELDVTEPVLVTQISDPYRVYCQLRSFSKEIKHLSDAMYQAFETANGTDLQENLPTPGSPCAARGIDGCWYRALLLEIYPGSGPEEQPGAVAQVICVDYGRKEFVTKRNLRCLPGEYFRMPVVTYPCSLQGIADRGCGWARSQISELKTLLLGKVVQAHIEAYCPFEHLYYVTLYAEDGLNLNCLFGVQAHCLAQSLLHSNQEYISDMESISAPSKKEHCSPPTLAATVSQMNRAAALLPGVRLKAGKCYSARISFLQDPTEFWVHLQEHLQPLCHLKQNLHDFYSQSKKLEGILLQPQLGSLCCVMLKENSYHRALITKVQGKDIEVYLVDRGNTEVVDLTKVKELLPQFRDLPAVALRCALANPSSSNQLWSPGAVDYFRKAVLNKELVIQVLGMQGDIYIVELFDNSLAGEKNVGKIMSQGNYTEHQKEVKEPLRKFLNVPLRSSEKQVVEQTSTIKLTKEVVQPLSTPRRSAPYSMKALTVEQSNKSTCHFSCKAVAEEDSSGTPNPSSYPVKNYSEIRPGFSREEQLEVGSTVDVVVSYIESPSLFWCQLDQNSQDLKVLMFKIQDYCANSAQPHDWPNPVCLAKYSPDGTWYRALILNTMSQAEEVEVAYVDYGNKELVSRKDLRETKAEFLQLKAQAFRCSLYNLIQPNGQDPFVWDEKGTEAFEEFVDAASRLELKCTIFALAALNNKDLFNIVDLITPFESVCHFLTRKGLARAVQPEKPLTSSVHLLSYYYSTHDLKIGSEEIIYVTHVNDPCLFYCQLARSANVLEQLTTNIGKLSKTWHSLQISQAPGSLYLAKYTDGCWYRATVFSAKSKEAFFVDFGNTQLLKSEDLIPIPNNAYEILLMPMQAIKCSLSDVSDVSKDSAMWFEKTVLDKPLKALVVAKEPDGKLIVELYDGRTKINAKLKERLGLQHNKAAARHAEKETSVSRYPHNRETNTGPRRLSLSDVVRPAPEFKRWRSENQETSDSCRPGVVSQEAKQFEQKSKRENVTKFFGSVERAHKIDPIEDRKGSDCAFRMKREERPDNLKKRDQSKINVPFSLKKVSDLPKKIISPGLKTLVYVSHINNPSDFYVQLVEDEPLLDSISEKLNNSAKVESLKGQELYIGDLVCAFFPEDDLWYRAVVREKPSGELVSVQYIDYGNTSVVDSCKIFSLPEDCSSFPVMSVHCLLGGMKTTNLPDWPQEAVQYFQQKTSEIQINGEFREKCKDKWEILLCEQEGSLSVELVNSYLQSQTSLEETSEKKECTSSLINLCETLHSSEDGKPSDIPDCKSFVWKLPEIGQIVQTYSVIIKSPGYFWCQFADTDAISSVEKKLQEARELAKSSVGSIKSGSSCLVQHEENTKLYRAVVSSVEGDVLRIIHVDYGTEKLVSKEMIMQISHELLTIPPQAFPCSLFGFNASEGSWAEEANRIFCELIVGNLLDVTVMKKQKSDHWEIPLFVVKLESQTKNINEQMKPFWIHPVEDSGPTSNIHIAEMQHENIDDDEEEDLEVVPFETAISACRLMALKDNSASEDVCFSELSQPIEKCSVDVESRSSLEMPFISPEYQTRYQQGTFEILDTEGQPTTSETFRNEKCHSLSDKERNIPISRDLSEMHLPAYGETEVLGQNSSEAKEKAESKVFNVQDLGDEESFSDLVSLERPPSDDTKQLLLELEMLRSCSCDDLRDLLELESVEGNPPLCDETKERSELDLLEVPHMQTKLEQTPLLTNNIDHLLLELATPKVLLQANEVKEEVLHLEQPAAVPLADNENQPLHSDSESKQDLFCKEALVEAGETGPGSKKDSSVKWQTLLDENWVEQISQDVCDKLSENSFVDDASLRRTLLNEEEIETSSPDSDETVCSLKGFDIGSRCMVWSGVKWFKAQILGISAEGTKVLNLSSGHEEIVNPVNVWNGIPEVVSSLSKMLQNNMDTLCPMPAGDLPTEANEVTYGSDNNNDPSVCCDNSADSAFE